MDLRKIDFTFKALTGIRELHTQIKTAEYSESPDCSLNEWENDLFHPYAKEAMMPETTLE